MESTPTYAACHSRSVVSQPQFADIVASRSRPRPRVKDSFRAMSSSRRWRSSSELALVIACEGTRKTDGKWKSGFYNIAQAAGVPIVPAFADNDRMVIGFGEPITPTGNYGEDLLKLALWFQSKIPGYERYLVLEQQARDIIAGKNDI